MRNVTDKKKLAEQDYRRGMKFKDIAEKYSINESTIKSWAKRNSWSREKVARKNKSCAEKVAEDLKEKLFESVDKNAELTERQKLFCIFYLQSFNATQAYLNAYGGDYNSASTNGYRLLKNDKIQSEIKKLQESMREHFDFRLEDYISQLLKIVGADIRNFVKFGRRDEEVVINKNGDKMIQTINFIDLKDIESADTSAISELKIFKGDVTIKLHDKISAMKELARILGFGDNINEENVPVVISGENELED